MTTLISKPYVIQSLDAEGQPEYQFVAREDAGWRWTDDLDVAAGFGSRLAADRFAETHAMRQFKIARRDAVAIKPKKFEAPFALAISCPLEAVQTTFDLHEEYCQRVEAWLQRAGCQPDYSKGRPTPCMTITAPKWAGMYSSDTHHCHYPAVYAMLAPENGPEAWRTIVAHEVVHAYQRAFTGRGAGHGPDFYALMKHAAREPVTSHTHGYSVKEARRLSEKLLPWWELTRQQGLLASLPLEVLTTKTKRKGIR